MTDMEKTIERYRSKALPCNLRNFDLTVSSFIEEIEARPFDDGLTEELFGRLADYARRIKSTVPPLLCHRPGESTREYLDRCYDAGGYDGDPSHTTETAIGSHTSDSESD